MAKLESRIVRVSSPVGRIICCGARGIVSILEKSGKVHIFDLDDLEDVDIKDNDKDDGDDHDPARNTK